MMNKFQIVTLTQLNDLEFIQEFSRFSFDVRKDPHCTGLITEEHTRKLIEWGFYNGSQFWLIKNHHGKTILRISFRISKSQANTGTIGFFEIDLRDPEYLEAFTFTIQEIENIFGSKEVKNIFAPIDLNTWFNYRFSLGGKKYFPRYTWEPTTPPEYLNLFRNLGYKDSTYFNSVFFRNIKWGFFAPGTGHLKSSFKRIKELNFSLRPFNMKEFFDQELPLFHKISHEAFSDALLFEPIDLETFRALYAAAKTSYDFSPSCVLLSPEGETAGFLFAFFDQEVLVIKSIALLKKYQGLKLSSGMIYSAVKMAFDQNKKITVSALVRTGLTSEKIAGQSQKWSPFNWTHDYVLVKKEIP